ncbi:GcrA cell cycle regulator [Agrobacterium rhizogenes]|nr:GcrA cell cycle regulator [Rhizobium rhizogenes]NTH97018.1 GcrA cell cycle regulator [Rhizobium rhizogenes]NTJ15204.1 GcrA cell cycle regulator [Rhizobium rhizogenes]
MNPWDNGKVELLKRLVAEGLSANQIAIRIGGVSRNAVIGKVTRLKLSLHGQPLQAAPKKAIVRTPRMPKSKADPAALAGLKELLDRVPPPAVDAVPKPKSFELTLMELERDSCRWPEGERAGITFCGHLIEDGKSYCAYHARLSRGAGTLSERRAARELERAA